MPPHGDPGQHFTIDCDLLAKINNTNINAIWINRNMKTWCHFMAPLNSCRVGPSTEDLHTLNKAKVIISTAFGLSECEILIGYEWFHRDCR